MLHSLITFPIISLLDIICLLGKHRQWWLGYVTLAMMETSDH